MAIRLDLAARVCPFVNPCTLHPNRSRAGRGACRLLCGSAP